MSIGKIKEKKENQIISKIKKDDKQEKKSSGGILELLVAKKLITKDQVMAASLDKNENPVEVLIKMGFISESVVFDILSQDQNQKEKIDLKKITPDWHLLQKLPKDFAKNYKIFPIEEDEKLIKVATNDPYNIMILDQVSNYFDGKEVEAIHYKESEIIEVIDKFYKTSYSDNILDIIAELDANAANKKFHEDTSDGSPIVRFVDMLLYEALGVGASDIHVEPDEYFVRIRFRIDGVMMNKTIIHKNYWSGICVRLKVLSGMNIAESRKPQDGGMNMILQGRPVDFRVSAIPTIYGENIVIRILDRTKSISTLEELGFNNYNLDLLKLALERPEGIIVVTGPTGSGKTTTLYSTLAMINSIDQNIMTLEEPVEYRLPIIRQSEINHRAGFDFASGLRSLLRQDPDIIFLGEIRDQETAQTAIRASITGHQVFSTLHTNGAITAVTRLIDMGIQPFMLSGALIAVIAQRLARKLCPYCKVEVQMSKKMKEAFMLDENEEYLIYEAKGCDKCFNIGYKGRIVISEILFIGKELNIAISSNPTIKTITEAAEAEGFLPIQRDGILKIVQGITSWDEIRRTIDMTSYLKKLSL